jgi:hypothetical protein
MLTPEQVAWLKEAVGFDYDEAKAASGGAKAASGAADAPAQTSAPPAHVGKNPNDPALKAPQKGQVPNQELFLKEPGDAGDVDDKDINQGYIGDCFLLASIGEIARVSPAMIKHMIKDNKDGTYTVTLYQKEGGLWAGIKSAFGDPSFKAVAVTVDGNFPAGGSASPNAGQDVVGGKKEIWPQLIEKAYAKLHGGYSGIDKGGSPQDALEALTGHKVKEKSVGGVSLKDLQAAFQAGKPIVMNTPDKPTLPYNLVGDHAYMLDDIVVDAKGAAQIKLRNPWGTTQIQPPQLIPFDKLGTGIDSIDIGAAPPKEKP